MKIALTMLMMCGLVACSSGSSDGGSSTSGGSTGNTGDGINHNPATVSLTGDAAGTFASPNFVLSTNANGTPGLSIMHVYGTNDNDPTSGLTLTAPAGAKLIQVGQTWGFTALPATGTDYTETSATVCGGFAIQLLTENYIYNSAKGCDGSNLDALGSMTAHFDSLTKGPQPNPGVAPTYFGSGKVTAHLAPQSGTGAGADVVITFTSGS